jgi:hypothetical protein
LKVQHGENRVSGFWFLVSGFWFLVSGFWFLVSGFWKNALNWLSCQYNFTAASLAGQQPSPAAWQPGAEKQAASLTG